MLNNLLLLSLRSPFLDDSKVYAPMANLYLKAFLDRYSPQTSVTLGDDDYNLTDDFQFDRYDGIGISVMTPQRSEMSKLVKLIKTNLPETKIIVGGPHVKHYTSEVEAIPEIDFVVPFDGERPLSAICNGEAKERVLTDLMGKKDIEQAPRPDRTSPTAVKLINNYHYMLGDRKATTMMTSRGCPMKCTFCEDAMTPSKWSSLANLKDEMDDVTRLGFRGVYIFDDLFAIAMPIVRPIVHELSKRDLVYRCNGQANFFTKWGEDFARLLADTGCREIAFGHESGSQKILDNVRKQTTIKQNYDSIDYAKKYGIKVKSFVMLGLPGETLETIAETERFIATAGMDDFQLAIYFPYKGTQIRDAIDSGEKVGLTLEGEGLGAYGQKGGSTESVVRTKDLSSDDLLKIRDDLVWKYKPKSHLNKWSPKMEDLFFDTHLGEQHG